MVRRRTTKMEVKVAEEKTNLDGRVSVLEVSFERVERRVEAGFTEIGKALSRMSERMAEAPRAIPFKEIAATVAVCLGIMAYAGQFLEGQYRKNIGVLEYRIDQLEKRK
jgi:hypothetical protein